MALQLFLGEPYPADVIGLFIGRNTNVIIAVHSLAIGGAASVGDPHAGAGAHDGLEGSDQTARRMLHFDAAVVVAVVNVGLAVGQDDNLLALQVPVQSLFQAFRGPQPWISFSLAGHALDEFAHIAQKRLEFTALLAAFTQQALQFHCPIGARPSSHQQKDAEDHDGKDA